MSDISDGYTLDDMVTQLFRPSRTVTMNDGAVMVPIQWVKDLADIYDTTGKGGLEQETKVEMERYLFHILEISKSVTTMVEETRSKGPQ